MKVRAVWTLAFVLLAGGRAAAQEHRVEPLAEGPPIDQLSPAIAERLSESGFKVLRGASRTVCQIWFAKEWAAKSDFEPSISVLYPFEPGELIGVVKYANRGGDFRGQQIDAGVYTIRYAMQPEDGNHVGTSQTRDFLLLAPAKDDTDPAPVEAMKLIELSKQASGTTHPAMLSLVKVEGEAESLPALSHDEEHDHWRLRVEGQTPSGKLPLELVVVGKAAE